MKWLLFLAAALSAEPAAAQAKGCSAHEAALPGLVGLSEAQAIAALEAMPGITLVRFAAPGSPLTQDHREERITLLMRDGKVVAAACG